MENEYGLILFGAFVFTLICIIFLLKKSEKEKILEKKLIEERQKSEAFKKAFEDSVVLWGVLAEKYISFSELSKKIKPTSTSKHSKKLLAELQEYSEGLITELAQLEHGKGSTGDL